MPPQLTETEIDDLIYLSRTNELADFESELKTLAAREGCVIKDIVLAARDEMSGNGCLHMAAANGHVDILKFVLDPVSEDAALSLLSTPNEAGNTPLHYAALNGQLLAVQYLVGKGADPYLQNRAGHDAIYEAEINDKREAVEWMLREGGLDEEVEEGEVRGDGGEKVLVDEEALKVQVEDLVLGEKEEGKGKGRAE